MAVEEKSSHHGTVPIVVATAGVTLAIGITVATLSGYLGRSSDTLAAQVAQPETSPIHFSVDAEHEHPSAFTPGADDDDDDDDDD